MESNTKRLTIVIPCRETDSPNITLDSLRTQDVPYDVVISYDEGRGANFARNKGFREVDSELVMFCDNDVTWRSGALQLLLDTLDAHPEASYAYGAYYLTNKDISVGEYEFDAERLKAGSFISPMVVMRTKDFPGWDESITNFQDWDLFLTMLEQGKVGVYCGQVVFDTKSVDRNFTSQQVDELVNKVKLKHGITT